MEKNVEKDLVSEKGFMYFDVYILGQQPLLLKYTLQQFYRKIKKNCSILAEMVQADNYFQLPQQQQAGATPLFSLADSMLLCTFLVTSSPRTSLFIKLYRAAIIGKRKT